MTAPDIPVATDRDVLITRAFAAPRSVVWRFFTEGPRLAEWFGPVGVAVDPATTVVEPRVGGRWELTMVDQDCKYSPIRGVFTAFDPEEYLEIRMSARPDPGVELDDIVVRLWFHDHGDRTRLTLHQGPFEPEFRARTAEGWELSFGKIDQLVGA
jgi:uncharacterized protein YndB with AHSA1/START domain